MDLAWPQLEQGTRDGLLVFLDFGPAALANMPGVTPAAVWAVFNGGSPGDQYPTAGVYGLIDPIGVLLTTIYPGRLGKRPGDYLTVRVGADQSWRPGAGIATRRLTHNTDLYQPCECYSDWWVPAAEGDSWENACRKTAALIAHEVGHCLGLPHNNDPGSLMHESARVGSSLLPGEVDAARREAVVFRAGYRESQDLLTYRHSFRGHEIVVFDPMRPSPEVS